MSETKGHRPKKYVYWPISFGWYKQSSSHFFDYHRWPIDGSEYYPDTTAKTLGWTIHIGYLKIYFGSRKDYYVSKQIIKQRTRT